MKQQDKKRKRLKVILLVEILLFLILALCLAGYLYVKSIWNKINHIDIDEDIKINEEIVKNKENHLKGYMNIALFGIDTNGSFEKGARSDSIIIASINNDTKDIILTSVYRDTFLDTTEGEFRKATEVYALGGPAQALNMLNVNLDMNITQFVAIDWNGLIDTINLLGGIEVEITSEEGSAINSLLKDTARDSKAPINLVNSHGLIKLDGVQATAFARIRSLDNDYNRTERQRKVLEAVFNKAKKMDIITLNKIANEALPKVATNIKFSDGLSFLQFIGSYNLKETQGFPFEKGSGFHNSQWILYPDDLKTNVEQLHLKIYGKPYQASPKVQSISEEIKAIVGGVSTQLPADHQGDLIEYQSDTSVVQPQNTQNQGVGNEIQNYTPEPNENQGLQNPPVNQGDQTTPEPPETQPEVPEPTQPETQPVDTTIQGEGTP